MSYKILQSPFEVDGTAIKSTFDTLTNLLVGIFLEIIVQIFTLFLRFLWQLLNGYHTSSPAVFLIGFMLFLTAYVIRVHP